MNTLTRQQLGMRLGSGLKVTHPSWNRIFKLDADGTTLNHVGIDYVLHKEAKPILRPWHYLTKEITHNGEKFVPKEKLRSLCDFEYYLSHVVPYINSCQIEFLPHWIVQYIISWHFVIDEPEGSYIEVTNEFNPYEK